MMASWPQHRSILVHEIPFMVLCMPFLSPEENGGTSMVASGDARLRGQCTSFERRRVMDGICFGKIRTWSGHDWWRARWFGRTSSLKLRHFPPTQTFWHLWCAFQYFHGHHNWYFYMYIEVFLLTCPCCHRLRKAACGRWAFPTFQRRSWDVVFWRVDESLMGVYPVKNRQGWSQVFPLARELQFQRCELHHGLWTAELWPAKQISAENEAEEESNINK